MSDEQRNLTALTFPSWGESTRPQSDSIEVASQDRYPCSNCGHGLWWHGAKGEPCGSGPPCECMGYVSG